MGVCPHTCVIPVSGRIRWLLLAAFCVVLSHKHSGLYMDTFFCRKCSSVNVCERVQLGLVFIHLYLLCLLPLYFVLNCLSVPTYPHSLQLKPICRRCSEFHCPLRCLNTHLFTHLFVWQAPDGWCRFVHCTWVDSMVLEFWRYLQG